MYIFNTLSGKKELLKKPKNRPINLFVCGPTVYDLAHIGHARTQLAFDVIVKYLRAQGWKIFYLQNITDIDDKIIDRAKKEKKDPLKLAHEFEETYYRDMKALGINTVDTYARASKFIPEIVRQVQTLIKKEYAYEIPNQGYYFNIKKFKNYGELARRTITQAEDGVSRIDESIKKKNKGDFALWKFVNAPKSSNKYKLVKGEPAWKTTLGWGRPGWHIEDTAMTESFFGPQYDLHGGGLDLKFPHHEAEIAQQEAASGKKPFVKIWMHAGLIRIENKKMSKSLGNFITIESFLKKHDAELFRWIILMHHYRSPAHYSEKLVEQSKKAREGLDEFIQKLTLRKQSKKSAPHPKKQNIQKEIQSTKKSFEKAMEDDFNTREATAKIFEFLRNTNPRIWSLTKKEVENTLNLLKETLGVLGINTIPSLTPKNIQEMMKKRELSRAHKQFVQADTLRKKIEALGYIVEDTPLGPLARKK
ncbi:cysteine--tRNA ligase [bacterium]|nr:cysteine--tRNA ligase [bacterium]|tara:strand:- start:5988 stop:7415 length:1428 start_codon:yes stop_codon:yes gene_type:complete